MIQLSKEQVRETLMQPNGTDKLMPQAEAAFEGAWALFLEGFAPACGFLCRIAKRKAAREKMNALLASRAPLWEALQKGEAPKLRKNAARLMGELGEAEDVPALCHALKAEQQRFVRPSILLALGALGGEQAQAAVEEYTVQPPQDETETKLAQEETDALAAAKRSFLSTQKHTFKGLDAEYELVLHAPDRLADGLARELNGLAVRPAAVHASSVHVHTKDVAALYGARCFDELLFVISANAAPQPKAIAIKAKTFLEKLLPASHEGNPPFGYRIEIRGEEVDRGEMVRELVRYLESSVLTNAPGAYEVELRIVLKQNGCADLFAKLYTIPDHRFDYRLLALPASMHPVTAAAVLRYAEPYLTPNARVLDPCCGSGTLLIERGKLTPCASLTGVDIAHKAIDAARINGERAGADAKFIVNDCLRFEAHRQYDELVANLPFGNRVGSHKENVQLYAGLLDRLPQWLKRNGVAVLYTMEYTLLKKLVRQRPGLKLMTEARTDAGGLMPAVFILKVQA